MEYRPLGGTGISVSELCLGGMMFGSFGNDDHEDAARVVHKALDAGINVIDTADGYSSGESETILGKALAGRRDKMVLAVKLGVAPGGDVDPNERGASRRWIIQAVEGSLRRLRTDWIDLYQVGAPDHLTDIDESLSALTDLVRAGKIRAFGSSKVTPSRIVEAQTVSDRRGHERFRSEQSPYNMLTRQIEFDLLPTCARHGIGVMAFGPLAGGWLSGRHRYGAESAGPGASIRRTALGPAYDIEQPANADKLDAAIRLGALAEEAGMTLIQMATAFVLNHPAVSTCIVGPRIEQHLDGYLAADGVKLSDELLDRVDEIVAPGATVKLTDNMWQFVTTDLQPGNRRRG